MQLRQRGKTQQIKNLAESDEEESTNALTKTGNKKPSKAPKKQKKIRRHKNKPNGKTTGPNVI